jgi:hypothetical protein
MMASGSSGNPYDPYGSGTIEQDLIDPDDGKLLSLHVVSNKLTLL